MAATLAQHPFVLKIAQQKDLLFPIAFISLIAVILVPLPPFILDLLLVVNITLSIIILSTTIYVKSPLEFAVLPSLLLAITLFRLVLNVATTRLILTAGDRASSPESAMHAAGVEVHFWVVNDPIRMRELVARGADGIVTDRADLARDALR